MQIGKKITVLFTFYKSRPPPRVFAYYSLVISSVWYRVQPPVCCSQSVSWCGYIAYLIEAPWSGSESDSRDDKTADQELLTHFAYKKCTVQKPEWKNNNIKNIVRWGLKRVAGNERPSSGRHKKCSVREITAYFAAQTSVKTKVLQNSLSIPSCDKYLLLQRNACDCCFLLISYYKWDTFIQFVFNFLCVCLLAAIFGHDSETPLRSQD